MLLPDYLIYSAKTKNSSIQIRKLTNEVGIIVTEKLYDFPGDRHAEFFIDKRKAIDIIKALMNYLRIGISEIE